MLSQIKPPFRAEQIGSLLRPQALLEQRTKFARGEIGQAALTTPRTRRSRMRSGCSSASG